MRLHSVNFSSQIACFGNTMNVAANLRKFSTFPSIIQAACKNNSVSAFFASRQKSGWRIPFALWSGFVGGLFTTCFGSTAVCAGPKDKDVVTLGFNASGPPLVRGPGTQYGLNTQLTGSAVLYLQTGKIDFTYSVSVLHTLDGSPCDVPIKIVFKLLNERGHLLEALEVRTGNGNNQPSVFPVSKEILSMTTKIVALISYNV